MSTAILDSMTSWNEATRTFIEGRQVLAIIDPMVDEIHDISSALNAFKSATSLTSFTAFSPNPTWDCLATILEEHPPEHIDCVIAIGGGTAIDLAKLTATALQLGSAESLWTATQQGQPIEQERHSIRLMAIPTTAGTGAEATRFAVLYRDQIKHSVVGNSLMPDAYALDPSLLKTLPSSVIADAGLDAACQAMESLWSVRSTDRSEEEAWAALDLVVEHLAPAVNTRSDDALAGMLLASHRAGNAINLTTTTAPHALSYGLTSEFGIPHGRAVGYLFGPVFKHTARADSQACRHPKGSECTSQRLEAIAQRWSQTVQTFPDWWTHFLQQDLSLSPAALELDDSHLDRLSKTVNAVRLSNHPCTLTQAAIRTIYTELATSKCHPG